MMNLCDTEKNPANHLLKWCEINLSQLKRNIANIKTLLSPDTKILAVIKDNAYSHGQNEIARTMLSCGINYFAVSTIDEAILLRENGIDCPILILSYTVPSRFYELIKFRLVQTVFSTEYGLLLENYLKSTNALLDVQLMIDTGMHREGILYDKGQQELEDIKRLYRSDFLHVVGIYTHFSVADSRIIEDMDYTRKQEALFQTLLQALCTDGIHPGMTHVQNSPAVLNYPEFQYDYIRIGTLLLGMPYGDVSNLPNASLVSPIFTLKAKIVQIKDLSKNKSVSYGKNYTTKEPSKIAVVSLGYGDGYPRNLSNQNMKVIINGTKVNVAGDICMDQLTIDISDLKKVSVGDVVTLISTNPSDSPATLQHIANTTNCLMHEIMTKIGSRVTCCYINSQDTALNSPFH